MIIIMIMMKSCMYGMTSVVSDFDRGLRTSLQSGNYCPFVLGVAVCPYIPLKHRAHFLLH